MLATVALISAAHVVHPDGAVGQITYVAVTAGAAVAASIGARRQSGSRRFAWTCVALGVSFSALGDAYYYLMGLIQGSYSDLSVADAFWLASYVGIAVGLSTMIVGNGSRRVDVDGLIDIGSFVVLAVIVVTQLSVVRDTLSDTSFPIFSRLVWSAYPVLDAALLGVVTQAIVSKRLRNVNGLFLSLGVALWLVADFASLLIVDKTTVTRWLDVGWMIGAVCIAASAWPSATQRAQSSDALAVRRVSDARIAITLLPLLVPGVIEIWALHQGHDPSAVPLFFASVVLVGLAFARSTRLVKSRNRQEVALERKTWFYTALAENSSDAVVVVDKSGRILNEAPNLAAMLGRTGEVTTGMDGIELLQLVDRDASLAALDRWSQTTLVVDETEVRATNLDGSERWFGIRAANLSDDPVVGGIVINLRDITDRKRAEDELSHNALHDSLTGLANRALFHDRLEHALDRTSRTGSEVAVVYLDLDGFKVVNDSRGHESGDVVLREVAARLTSGVRNIDTVSRHGGDEFAILVEESAHAVDEARTVADRVLKSLTLPFTVDGQSVVLSASIGIAIGDVSCTASSMMRDADLAMYKAKTTGRAHWAMYEPSMRTDALEQLELENDLRQALDRHQFRLMYQPIIELQTNVVVGFEALIRWDHPTLGLIEPDAFIPIAERNGTIVTIGKWVLDEACRTAAGWRDAYSASRLTMAVNLSVRQIATPELVDHVANALDRWGLEPSSLVLEMTESVLVQDAAVATQRLEELRALGVRLAIDDFGTGYSSLSYLRQFPIDILKIDRSFTNTITDDSLAPAIVRGLLDLAKTLRIETVAEGIELDIQRDSLRDQHCDFGQGFLFAKPLSLADASEVVAGIATPVQAR